MNILDDEDDEDEDYNELENSFEKDNDKFLTRLDLQDEVLFFRDVLNYLSQNNPDYYTRIMNLFNDNLKCELGVLIDKAQLRGNKAVTINSVNN